MFRTIISALVFAFLSSSVLSAQTVIPGGNVSGLWTAVGSPYLIEGDITIPTDELLIIEPGVEVYFQGQYSWTVTGWLEATGTPTDSILMTAQDTSLRWLGFIFWDAPDSSYLEYCIIEYATGDCGGVCCSGSNPVISHCTLRYNIADLGGAIGCAGSNPRITFNDIVYNEAFEGGGLHVGGSPIIAFNNISDNHAYNEGGGLSVYKGCDPLIICNYITNNKNSNDHADGGGIYTWGEGNSVPLIENIIVDNSVVATIRARGGGICGGQMNINKMVIYHNVLEGRDLYGGGIYNYASGNEISHSIIWRNSPDQIYGPWGEVTYCNVQDGWPGLGNIDEDPLFVAPEFYDFRLQWGSPCIDSGNPDSIYNDPDGTRADMGSFYYDQSVPVRVLLTPHERSIVIPPEGGSFDYTIWLTNIDPSNPQFQTWIDITLPDGTVFGPVLGPATTQLDSGSTIRRERTQHVPAGAIEGIYTYNGYAVAGSDTSFDSFNFFKLESDGFDGSASWENTGESFNERSEALFAPTVPKNYSLPQNHPNPFNTKTTLRFTLPEASKINLTIYNLSGQTIATLIDGYRQAGSHEVTWDGSEAASGVYICQLRTSGSIASGKIVLLK